jgi:hypothetical protein
MSKLKFGLQHPCFAYDGKGHAIFETVKERAQYAEEHGFDSFFVMDHFMQIPYVGTIDEPMLESWTTISALTQVTSKIKLGTLVTGSIYRNPAYNISKHLLILVASEMTKNRRLLEAKSEPTHLDVDI